MFSTASNIKPGNYLITGATGTMGTHALLRLQNKPGIFIRAAYHTNKPRVFADNFEYCQVDLTNKEDCWKIVAGMDYVFMFAGILSTAPVIAKDPISHVNSNLIMNALMLEAAYRAKVSNFLWLSSTTGYPTENTPLDETKMFLGDPPNNYFSVGWMTRYIETLCRMYATKLKDPMSCIILRPTNIYSEYGNFDLETCHFLPALVRKIVERHEPIEIWDDGTAKRDLIYADDVFDACLLALEKVEQFDVFNIGSGDEHTINDIIKLLIQLDSFTDAKIVHNRSRPTSISKRFIDLSKMKNVLGFKPKTSLKNGICKMIETRRYYK